MYSLIISLINTILNIVIALSGLFLLIIACYQLKNLAKSNELGIILDIEKELNERKSQMDEIISKIRIEGAKTNPNHEIIEIYDHDLKAAKENYFNALDRLSFCNTKEISS